MEEKAKGTSTLKLDYARTLKVGFAFLGIMMFWEVYDYIMPLILANYFGLTKAEYGIIMGLDNLFAIFLLPFFGSLSDKAIKAKYGRRTTFIFWGSIAAAISVIFLMIAELQEYKLIVESCVGNLGDGKTLPSTEKIYQVVDQLISNGYINESWRSAITTTSDMSASIIKIQTEAARTIMMENPAIIVFFIISLLLILVAMSSYRSPAIALMPDVTPKPLRSQANALITLMGGAGGLLSIIIYKFLASQKYESHVALWCVTGGCLIIILVAYLFFVKEKKFVQQREEEEVKFNVVDEEEEEEKHGVTKLPKEKMVSLVLILATVFLWFMGYNCVRSHLSVYSTQYLGFTQSFVGTVNIFNGIGGAVALLPCALLASKLGRKKTIFIGLAIATIAFVPSFFMTKDTPGVQFWFPFCFILSGFGMVFINVNTLPMVTELSKGSNVGKYTGYYYVASMTAQAVTPLIAGVVMDKIANNYLFVYSVILIALAAVTTAFIKYGDNKADKKKNIYEYFDDAAD